MWCLICSSSDEEDEDLGKHKDNILPKDRKRKRHDAKKKVSIGLTIATVIIESNVIFMGIYGVNNNV